MLGRATDYLNLGQIPVMAFDAKLIQWYWPDVYEEDKFTVMFGGLHIEDDNVESIR